jgi:hypothetical protein
MKNFFTIVIAFLVVAVGAIYNQNKTEKALEDIVTLSDLRQMGWNVALDRHKEANIITNSVGVIQFLENGFSISLDSAEWKTEGLELTGRLGNSTNLQVSSLTLKIIAQRSINTLKEEFFNSEFTYPAYLFYVLDQIGTGQTSIGTIERGGTASFKITVPNVKPSDKDLVYKVVFTGERYAYY